MKYYNKINRNFKVKARLYYNKTSHNRLGDDTPRYFVKIKSLKSLERIAFSSKAESNFYVKYQPNFYGAKKESYLNAAQLDDIINDLNSNSPYGFDTGVSGSLDDYNNKVKYNYDYQSFYNNFWRDNLGKVKTESSETYPFIEVELNELVKSKFLIKTPETFAPITAEESISYNYVYGTYSCDTDVSFDVTTGMEASVYGFTVDGTYRKSLTLGRHKQYTFTNTNLLHQESCLTGVLPFRISETSADGCLDSGGATLTSGVNVSGAGSLTGSEVLVLTTDEHTPNMLWYYSPLDSGIGAPIAVMQGCDGTSGTVSHVPLTPYAVWNSGVSSVSVSGDQNVVDADAVPDHCVSSQARGWAGYPNDDSALGISGQGYEWQIPQNPDLPASGANTRVPLGAIGIALNGVPLYNAYDSDGNNLVTSEVKDDCIGFVTTSGKYMYRQNPKCTYVDVSGEHSPIVGYAFDGYPIYGPRDDSGIFISDEDLDQYHGHNQSGRGYHYHVTTSPPYILGAYYKGIPNSGNFNNLNSPAITGYPLDYRSV